jgi:pSer/pThr/pTyr-binding forkhead associated (FHA) protein
MNSCWYVEILARNGEVKSRHRASELPIRLGRAYDNDFILDDLHTAAHHAIVEASADGSLQIRDLGSKNGVIHKGRRYVTMRLDGADVVRLGHTNLRVRASDFAVPDEIADTTLHNWEGAHPATIGLALITLLSASNTWLFDTDKFQAIHYLLEIISLLGAAMAWSGLWALANRLFAGHARFGRHIFILACGLMALQLWEVGSGVLAYALSLEFLTRYGGLVAIAILLTMVSFHLHTIHPQRGPRFRAICAFFAVLASGITMMTNYQNSGHAGSELYMHILLPPEFRISKDESVQQFLDGAAELKAKADAASGKTINGDPVDVDEND